MNNNNKNEDKKEYKDKNLVKGWHPCSKLSGRHKTLITICQVCRREVIRRKTRVLSGKDDKICLSCNRSLTMKKSHSTGRIDNRGAKNYANIRSRNRGNQEDKETLWSRE